jgi:hypothetical protein
MVILVGPSNFCVWDVWIDFLHMVFCRSTLEQRVARPRRYGFCIALFLRRRSSEAPSAQRRSRRVAVTISAGHESGELTRLPRPKIDRYGFLVSCRSALAPWGPKSDATLSPPRDSGSKSAALKHSICVSAVFHPICPTLLSLYFESY